MAIRPVFVAQDSGFPLVKRVSVDFRWYPGFSLQQKQKSIYALHGAAEHQIGLSPLLEISSKSPVSIGKALSAFSLELRVPEGRAITVEVAFQGSKVFEGGGPYADLFDCSPREAKRDPRLRESGQLVGFEFGDFPWPLEPKTAFYDWLYLNALKSKPDLANALSSYQGFTDIEFNPNLSINCQAGSAALYVALKQRDFLAKALVSEEAFLQSIQEPRGNPTQPRLFR